MLSVNLNLLLHCSWWRVLQFEVLQQLSKDATSPTASDGAASTLCSVGRALGLPFAQPGRTGCVLLPSTPSRRGASQHLLDWVALTMLWGCWCFLLLLLAARPMCRPLPQGGVHARYSRGDVTAPKAAFTRATVVVMLPPPRGLLVGIVCECLCGRWVCVCVSVCVDTRDPCSAPRQRRVVRQESGLGVPPRSDASAASLSTADSRSVASVVDVSALGGLLGTTSDAGTGCAWQPCLAQTVWT
jgi:hypothetical protein